MFIKEGVGAVAPIGPVTGTPLAREGWPGKKVADAQAAAGNRGVHEPHFIGLELEKIRKRFR